MSLSERKSIATQQPEPPPCVQLKSKSPNILVIFTKKSVSVIVQRAYDKGDDLKRLNEIAEELKKYLKSLIVTVG